MSAPISVFAVVSDKPAVCTCPKRGCPRHGNCMLCRNYHLNAKRPRAPYCERKPGLFKRIVSRLRAAAKVSLDKQSSLAATTNAGAA